MRHIAHIICNGTNPTLALLLLAAIFVQRRRGMWTFLLASALGIGLAVWLAELGKRFLPYPDPGGFPSGHETFATATATCLVWSNRRWLLPAILISIVMAVALVIAGYHQPIDVAGAAVLGPLPASTMHVLASRVGSRSARVNGA
jgi:membrane-associated phospholipid phosphatase